MCILTIVFVALSLFLFGQSTINPNTVKHLPEYERASATAIMLSTKQEYLRRCGGTKLLFDDDFGVGKFETVIYTSIVFNNPPNIGLKSLFL